MTDRREAAPGVVRVSVDVQLEPSEALERLIGELKSSLHRRGLGFEADPEGGVTAGGQAIARVVEWEPGRRAVLTWRPESWNPERETRVEIRVDDVDGASRLTIEQGDWREVAGGETELAGWFASEVAGRFLFAMTPEALGDWITDRWARRPSGERFSAVYRDPLYHYPNFRVILSELDLRPEDYLLDVGCGGGAMLKLALESGCRAAGVDHSHDLVRVAEELNRDAVSAGRLKVTEGDAASLPFPDGTFTCAAMTGVLGFLPEPVASLSEIRRVLVRGGRAVIMGTDPELRGTPGAPEPMASRLRFYDVADLEELGGAAGFGSVEVVRKDMEQLAREAGVPEEHLSLFSGPGARFLLVRND